MDAALNPLRRAFFRFAETGAALSARYHRARLLGTEHLPPRGPLLLVGNHGLWGYETPAFFHLLHQATGRYPRGLAERGFFKIPLIKTLLPWLGGVEGTRDNALSSLEQGHLVVCYPGGAWETFKKPRHHYTLRWEGTLGFVRLAALAGVPIVPFAGFGVDDTFVCSQTERWCFSLAPGEKYRVPLGMGLGPLPLPVKMTFMLGAPMEPPPAHSPESRLLLWKEQIASRVRHLLVRPVMPEALQKQHSAPPSLVPGPGDIQHGYELPCEERRVRGAPVRLFSFPEGCQDASRTVVCLPGLGASGRSFAPMRPLSEQWRLLLWTPPLATPLTHTPLQWNVASLADPEAGLPERFALVGSSFGSLVSIAFALAHPERLKALVLVSPVASVQRIRRGAIALSTLVRMPKPFAYLFAPCVARVMGGRHLPPEGRAEIVREARNLSPLEMLRRLQDILAADYLHQLERVRVPTLVVHGGRDSMVPLSYARDVAARIPGATLELIREAAHLPYMSHTDSFNAFVGDFLSRHDT